MADEEDDLGIQESDNTLSTGEEKVRVVIPPPFVPPALTEYQEPAQEDDTYAVRKSREASKRVRRVVHGERTETEEGEEGGERS